ncbi:hypothetical protein SDC9_60468 [bioreactor metagenome]|uniref:Uncharacterized protein n=1 Tax=bioreactor metagenome TaxID=1076179 RepID=A0A644XEA7_9ZZZZ
MFELVYTSAPRGLFPGRSGYATVALSAGMPPNLVTPVENLSGYSFTCRAGQFRAELNPVCCSYLKLHYGNLTLRVASRIAPNGLDYSGRNNKIAHHLIFESPEELAAIPGGACNLFRGGDNFLTDYREAPRELPIRRITHSGLPATLPARAWQNHTGDAGWAGVAAARLQADPAQPFYVVYPAGTEVAVLLELAAEISALLPTEDRDDFTFSTFFSKEQPGAHCFLRMIPDFSPLLGNLRRFHAAALITLSPGQAVSIPEEYTSHPLVDLARRGYEPIELDAIPPAAAGAAPTAAAPGQTPAAATAGPAETRGVRLSPPLAEQKIMAVPARARILSRETVTDRAAERKLLFLLLTALFLLTIPGVIYFSIFRDTAPENPPQQTEVRIATGPLPVRTMPANPSPEPLPANPSDAIHPKSVPVPNGVPTPPSPVGTPDWNMARNSAIPLAQHYPAAGLEMLKAWRRMAGSQNYRIILPGVLPRCHGVDVIFGRLGNTSGDLREFVARANDRRLFIYSGRSGAGSPLRPETDPGAPRLQIELDENTQTIQFTPAGGNSADLIKPSIDGITVLLLAVPDGFVSWSPVFRPEYLDSIPAGQVNFDPGKQQLAYRLSDAERAFEQDIDIYVGKFKRANFGKAPFPVDKWNKTVRALSTAWDELKKSQTALIAMTPADTEPPALDDLDRLCRQLENFFQQKDKTREECLAEYDRVVFPFLKQFRSTRYNPAAGSGPMTEKLIERLAMLHEALQKIYSRDAKKAMREEFKTELQNRMPPIQIQCEELDKVAAMNVELKTRQDRLRQIQRELEQQREEIRRQLNDIDPELSIRFDGLVSVSEKTGVNASELDESKLQSLLEFINARLIRRQTNPGDEGNQS